MCVVGQMSIQQAQSSLIAIDCTIVGSAPFTLPVISQHPDVEKVITVA